MKSFNIAVLAGDGIGPEVMREAIKVLRATEKKFGFTLNLTEAPVGWAGIDAAGKALPDATLALCKKSDSILFGSVGLPDRDPTIPKEERPERAALLRIRKEFGLFANLRPVKLPKALAHACPLAKERQGDGIDILVVRALEAHASADFLENFLVEIPDAVFVVVLGPCAPRSAGRQHHQPERAT